MVQKTKNKLKLLLIGIVNYTIFMSIARFLLPDIFSADEMTLTNLFGLFIISFISIFITHIYDRKTHRVLYKEQLPSSN